MNRKVIATVLFFALCAPAAHATKLYKWVDQDGNISYHDRPPNAPGYNVEEKNIRLGGRPVAGGAASEAAAKFPVVLYSAADCSSCDMARAYLQKRKVPFREKNVEGDRALQQELIKKTGAVSVPTILVGEKVMRGYLESLLEGELDAAGYPKVASGSTKASASEQAATQ